MKASQIAPANASLRKTGVFFSCLALCGTAVSAVGLLLLYLFNADAPIDVDGIHQSVLLLNNFYTSAYTVLIAALVLVFLLSAVLFRKLPAKAPQSKAPLSFFLRAAAGLTLVATAILQFVLPVAHTAYEPGTLQYIMIALAVLAGAGMLSLFSEKLSDSFRAFSGLLVAVWGTLHLLTLHFYMIEHINSPTRVTGMLSDCLLILYFVTEAGMYVSASASPGWFAATGFAAGTFALSTSLCKLILAFAGRSGFSLGPDAFYTLAQCALGAYALYNAVVFVTQKRAAPSDGQAQNVAAPGKAEKKEPGTESEGSGSENEESDAARDEADGVANIGAGARQQQTPGEGSGAQEGSFAQPSCAEKDALSRSVGQQEEAAQNTH